MVMVVIMSQMVVMVVMIFIGEAQKRFGNIKKRFNNRRKKAKGPSGFGYQRCRSQGDAIRDYIGKLFNSLGNQVSESHFIEGKMSYLAQKCNISIWREKLVGYSDYIHHRMPIFQDSLLRCLSEVPRIQYVE